MTVPDIETATRLPPLYYLHNFRLALTMLSERYAGLLRDEEVAFIKRFEVLPQPAQCLLTRLAMRKGALFQRATLQYTEVADFDGALQALVAVGWLDVDPLLCADDLSRVLNAEELRLALGIRGGQRAYVRHPAPRQFQLTLPLQEQPTLRRSLAQWNPRLAGRVVHFGVDGLIRRLQWLFFGNHYQTWAEFVLTDLGVKRYERVVIDTDARAFQTRGEITDFFRLNECREALEAGQPVSAIHESAFVPQACGGWLRSRFIQLQVRIGEALEAEGNAQLALRCYREGGAVEGLLRAVRLQQRQGLHEEAHADVLAAQQLPCSEAQQEALERAMARIRRRQGGMPERRPAADQHRAEAIELVLPRLEERKRVELTVLEHLSQPGSRVFYVENSLVTSLFGLLCWDALFYPVPGAFFHPFQTAPADLYTSEFRERRAPRLRSLLALLDTGEHEAVIWRVYREKADIFNNFVRWRRLRPALLRLALQCIPALHLKLCFERLLDDLQGNATGMPDLVQFWPAERRYRLIEVKGPGDRLQDNQRRWMKFFTRHAIPAAVCQVRWETDA